MEPARDVPLSDDPEFPSGPWTGYWIEGGCRFRQDLVLSFVQGRMSGDGIDRIGRFSIRGSYDPESREVQWTKQYFGAHSVDYRGYREGRGIWGTWDCRGHRGGFHIWPREDEEVQRKRESEEAELRRMLEEIVPGIVYG